MPNPAIPAVNSRPESPLDPKFALGSQKGDPKAAFSKSIQNQLLLYFSSTVITPLIPPKWPVKEQM